ncbi:MAG: serine hydrolase [Betaproteobacteria bacterium]
MTTSATADAKSTTLANWRSAPHSRWGFRNIDQLLATAVIRNDGAAARPLPEALRDFDDFRLALPDGEVCDLNIFLRQTHTDGLVVLADGRRVLEWYDEGMATDTRHILMSATKSVVGLLCGGLVELQLLDPEAQVTHYLPELRNSGYQGANVRQLMDMRAQPRLDGFDLRRYTASTNWDPLPPGADPGGMHTFFATLPPRHAEHGGPFRYISANTDLLGWILERVTGRPMAELLGDLLWSPMGAEHPAQITLDRDGGTRATGGMCTTLRDFARIGQLLLDDGASGAVQVLPPSWVEDIAQHGDREAWARGEFAAGFPGMAMHYRSGWYVIDNTPQLLFAMGIHGQYLFVDRTHRLVIAKLSAQPQPLDTRAIGLTLRAVTEIRRCILNA